MAFWAAHLASILIFSVLSPSDDVLLKWSPKVGDRAVFRTSLLVNSDLADHFSITGEMTEETVSVDPTQVVTKTSGTLFAEDSETGERIELPFKPDTMTMRPDGTVLQVKEEGEDPHGQPYRIARASSLVTTLAPVPIGGTWTVNQAGDVKKDLPDLKVTYTLVGEEKVGKWQTYKVTSIGGEIGEGMSKIEATFWIDKTSGARIRVHTKLTNKGDEKTGPTTIISRLERQ